MVGCAAFGCTNRFEKGFRMYGFPKDTDRRRKWLAQVRRSNLTITSNYNNRKLCMAHFEGEQFTRTKKGHLKLKADAVPTIFVHRPEPKRREKPAVRTSPAPPAHVHDGASDHTYCSITNAASPSLHQPGQRSTSLVIAPPASPSLHQPVHLPTSLTLAPTEMVPVEGHPVTHSPCDGAVGRDGCHHMTALLIWKNVSRTDAECVWKREKTLRTDGVAAGRGSDMTPSRSRAGIKRPVTQEDKEWVLASLLQLGRFTGMGWILSPEPQMFAGQVTSPGSAQAEDHALCVLSWLAEAAD